jgi:hypothetical protein
VRDYSPQHRARSIPGATQCACSSDQRSYPSRTAIVCTSTNTSGRASERNILGQRHSTPLFCNLQRLASTLLTFVRDAVRFVLLCPRPHLAFTWLAHWFDWHRASVIVPPATFIRWHRHGFRPLWRGNLVTDVRRFLRNYERLSDVWLKATRRGARGASPTNPCLSRACASRLARCASICPRTWTMVGITAFCSNTGEPLCHIMQGDHRMRLLCRRHGHLPPPLRVCGHRTQDTPHPTYHPQRTSHGPGTLQQLRKAIPSHDA